MSFQGDVAGIGLGELLQGLARGGKDGVLTLYGNELSLRLGLENGLVFLLDNPEEDPEVWRARAERAFSFDPDPARDFERREAIAKAARREAFFQLLDTQNLHFRFEPGDLPQPMHGRVQHGQQDSEASDSPWGQGMPVEYLLLEHARIADESSSGSVQVRLDDVPVLLSEDDRSQNPNALLDQIDGRSTVMEIADRLGWPCRQVRGLIAEGVGRELLRLCTPTEQLALANAELEGQRLDRAAHHLAAWLASAPAGPPLRNEAQLLWSAWEGGQLQRAAQLLGMRQARALYRKLDALDTDLQTQLERWRELAEHPQAGVLAKLHYHALRTRLPKEEHQGSDGELLRLARGFLANDQTFRARCVLRVVAALAPDSLTTRIELGTRLLEAGLLEMGSDWMIEAAQELLVHEELEKATQVLYSLLQSAPNHRVANGMLLETRERLRRKTKNRWNIAIGAAFAVVLSGSGVIWFQRNQMREQRLIEITELLHTPSQALALLEKYFPGDESERIQTMRQGLFKRHAEDQEQRAGAWVARFDEAEAKVRSGDLPDAFRMVVALPEKPDVALSYKRGWGSHEDLLALLGNRCEEEAERRNPSVNASDEELDAERKLLAVIEKLVAEAKAQANKDRFVPFSERLTVLVESLAKRMSARARDREELRIRDLENQQEQLLSSARFHARTGDFSSALDDYEALLKLDGSESLMGFLTPELDQVRAQRQAFEQALELARAGEHGSAIQKLEAAKLNLSICPLPWRVQSNPPGASVRLSDGSQRTTPFSLESNVGAFVRLEFSYPGCELVKVELDRPQDLMISLHKQPERLWVAQRQIEAIPVPIGGDQIVADRFGKVRRIDSQGKEVWVRELETLAGIARTPVFLRARPGHLLLLSEDGQAWILDAEDGDLEGPWTHTSAPAEGLVLLQNGVAALFTDGKVATWTDAVTPALSSARGLLERGPGADDGSFASERGDHYVALRRGTGNEPELGNPWTPWRIEVLSDHYLVRRGGNEPDAFTISRAGRWHFVAWERPNALCPRGRLWIADDAGLRSFLP